MLLPNRFQVLSLNTNNFNAFIGVSPLQNIQNGFFYLKTKEFAVVKRLNVILEFAAVNP